jgi:hypothetical protein
MQICLYIDEDAMARALVQGLRARGIEVTTVLEAGMAGKSDSALLEYAASKGLTVYTFNVAHFCSLHTEYMAEGRSHAGIIVVYRQRYSVGEQIRRLLKLIRTLTAEEMKDTLQFL